MERAFNKIIIVSLCDDFTRSVGETLSQTLDMLFCDCKDLLEYELIDKNAMKKLCTKQYLDACEKRVFKRIASFENVVVAMDFDGLIHNHSILNNESLIVFLKTSKAFIKSSENKINVIEFENRTEKLECLATLTVPINEEEKKNACEKIIAALGGIL